MSPQAFSSSSSLYWTSPDSGLDYDILNNTAYLDEVDMNIFSGPLLGQPQFNTYEAAAQTPQADFDFDTDFQLFEAYCNLNMSVDGILIPDLEQPAQWATTNHTHTCSFCQAAFSKRHKLNRHL
jgi:hypothetical protein